MTVLSAQTISAPIDDLLSNLVWTPTAGTAVTLSYDFLQQAPQTLVQPYANDPAENVGWAPLTAAQQAATSLALSTISSVANITFLASTDAATANILFGTDNQVSTDAYTGYIGGSYLSNGAYLMAQDHIELNNTDTNEDMVQGFTATVLHELANAMGLKDYDVDSGLPPGLNDLMYTVGSYFQGNTNFLDYIYANSPGGFYPVTPQMLDILALQYLYGANENGFTPSVAGTVESQVGNDHTYTFSPQTAPMTVWIGSNVSGLNCFDFSSCIGAVTIDLTPGSMSGTNQYGTYDSTTGLISQQKYPLQNVGIAYGTDIQIGIAGDYGATLYADATSQHENLLIGGRGIDTFVAGDGTDFFVGGGGTNIAEFHDAYYDYKIITGANGGVVLIDEAPFRTDGTVTLSPGFTQLEFSDQTVTLTPSPAADSSALVDQASDVPARLDDLEAYVKKGYVSHILLTDSGVPTLSVTAEQTVSDAQALAAIASPYQLQVTLDHSPATVDGPGGIATTVVLPDAASQYQITVAADGSVNVAEAGVIDHLVNVTAVQFSDEQVVFASQSPASAGGVSSAQITSLYAAVLDRTPDAGGLAFYEQNAVASPSTSITTYAEYFLSSPEYVQNSAHAYAETTAGDAQFITDTYQNLLHRAPEAGAVTFYDQNVIAPMLQGLVAGTAGYAQADLMAHATVLAYFSQSPEFMSDVTVTASHPVDAQHWLVLV